MESLHIEQNNSSIFVICSSFVIVLKWCLTRKKLGRTFGAGNKGRSTVSYRQSLTFDHPYLLCNDQCGWWVFQETLFSLFSEATVRRCSSNQVLLEILQYSQENICVGVSFWWSWRPYVLSLYFNLVTKEASTQVVSLNIAKFLRTAFLLNPTPPLPPWLLLSVWWINCLTMGICLSSLLDQKQKIWDGFY